MSQKGHGDGEATIDDVEANIALCEEYLARDRFAMENEGNHRTWTSCDALFISSRL